MRQLWALLKDTYQESLDRKSTLLLLLLAGGLVLLTFSISFVPQDPARVVEKLASQINRFRIGSGPTQQTTTMEVEFSVDEVVAARTVEDRPPGFEDGYVVRILFPKRGSLSPLIRSWWSFEDYMRRDLQPDRSSLEVQPIGETEEVEFFEGRFREFGYSHVLAERRTQAGGLFDPAVYRVFLRNERPLEVRRSANLSVGFGLFQLPLKSSSPAETLFSIQDFLANSFVGFFGMLVAISTCASFIPNLLQRGTLHLVLSRPISRGRLLLYKYFGSVIYVFVLAVVLFSGSAFGLWWSTGLFTPEYLLGIPSMTLVFAVVYSITVLFGVWTRSTNISSLAGLGIWALALSAGKLRELWEILFPARLPSLRRLVDAAHTVLPNTYDITAWNRQRLAASQFSAQAQERLNDVFRAEIDWAVAGSTTLAFTCSALALAVWSFQRAEC